MKYAGNGIFDRRMLSSLFGKKNRRPDAECWAIEKFVSSAVIGSGFEFKTMRNFAAFARNFAIRIKMLRELYADQKGDRVAFEVDQGRCRYAWFQDGDGGTSVQTTEWTTYGEFRSATG